ncbi:MAG: ATP-binding protein, partial [Simkania sp.]|nr:ATP-binding protein [Simkania sp.]
MTEPIQSANSTFSANISSLRPILAWIISQIEESPFDQAELRRIEVALEEALVNIIHYAYLDQEGEI